MSACVTTEKPAAYTPPVVIEKEAGPAVVVLAEPVTGTSVNSLARTIGPVTITVTEDASYTGNYPIEGGKIRLVEFLGKKALEVTQNNNNEIRVAFVLDEPAALAGYSTLSFSVAGFEGWDGIYNCGLLYTDAGETGERMGSFYVSQILPTEWISVEVNLAENEVWGKNFSEDRVLYCIQFWTNQSKVIYISDLALR